ncbi:MAG: TolC family protein [Candidatus Omnitrophica bacterium]|nr:TolC family protein [Candidatus Omnitrophota bacterium]
MNRGLVVFLAGLSFIGTVSLYAQEPAGGRELLLTLEEASRMALRNNLDIQIARFDASMKRKDLAGAVSVFDAILNARASYSDDRLQRTNSFVGSRDLTSEYGLGISKKLPTGTTVGVDVEHTRGWTNSAFATVNPAHDSRAKLSLQQEIGKNFFGLLDRLEVKITQLDIENADYTSLDKIEEQLAGVQKTYWQVVLNLRKVDIRKAMLREAEKLYRIYQHKLDIGLAELPDLYAAEANVNVRMNELSLSENDLYRALSDLMLGLNIDVRDQVRLLPADTFMISGAAEERFDEALRRAIENRRDYKRARNDVSSRKLNLVMKKNSLWPEIDLEASLIRNGVAAKFNESAQNVSDSDNPDYYFGVTVSFPLENTKARGEHRAAGLEKAKSLLMLKKTERKIAVEVHDYVMLVNTALSRARTARKTVELQGLKLKEEEKRLRYGRSDSDTLIRFQNDLLTAQMEYLNAVYGFYAFRVDLALVQNALLGEQWRDTL